MASPSTTPCGICEAQHVTKCAENWCPECEEGLCSDCVKHHSLSKATRNHEVISIENYHKLPLFITDITDSCKEHELKFTNYCQHHDQLCCPRCINVYHKKCEDLQPLIDLLKNSKTSALTTVLGDQLEEMLRFIDRAIKDREQNLSSLGKEQQSIMDEIKEIRSKVNSHLDTLEKAILKKLADCHTKNTSDIKTTVKKLSDKSVEIEEIKKNLMAVKTFGSDLQAFFGVKRIDEQVNKTALELKSTDFQQAKIVGTIDHHVTKILNLTLFGDINVQSYPVSIIYKGRDEKEAQFMAIGNEIAPKSINDIQLKLLSTFNIQPKQYRKDMRGCCVCPDGKLILTDNANNRLIIYNADNSYDKDVMINCTRGPFDVTVIDQRTIAVSTSEGIKIIDIETKKMKDEIKTKQSCYGITCYKDALFWCEYLSRVAKMILQDKNVSTILKRELPSPSFLASHRNEIYITDYIQTTLICCSLEGNEEWQFSDSSVLSDPACVTVDNNACVYVTSYKSNHVVVISPDGKEGRQLLSKKEGMDKPTGICFDRNTSNLLVVNRNGDAFLYHVNN